MRNNKFTWQNVYEEWVLYGEEDESWKKYEKQHDIVCVKDTTGKTIVLQYDKDEVLESTPAEVAEAIK